MFSSIIAAFSLYSRLPVPRTEWTDRSLRLVMAAFPLVGAVIALLQWGLLQILTAFGVEGLLRAALLAVLPVAVTGGIHLDGFLDTMDARSSWGDAAKKREILRDPHTGAFAVIWGGVYLLLWTAAWSALPAAHVPAVLAGFVLSRVLSGLAVTWFPLAPGSRMAAQVQQAADRRLVTALLAAEGILCAAAMLLCGGRCGQAMIAAAGITFLRYRRMAGKEFGGTSGDLAGWFLSVCELWELLAAAATGLL